jgi:hypothetical protein
MEIPVLSHLPCARRVQEQLSPERVLTLARDSVYVSVGLAVLAFQRAQVLRREIAQSLATRPD